MINLNSDSAQCLFLKTADSAEESRISEVSTIEYVSVGDTQLKSFLKNRMNIRSKAKIILSDGMEK